MTKAKRIALYLRVSTAGQTVENQRRELLAVAERHGWVVDAEFKDEGISGTKGRDKRPGFDALCQAIARREFDQVAAWSVDRLGRSLQDLVAFLGELRAKGVHLYLHQQGLDTSTPAGKAMFQMMGVFAEFERAMIVERVNAGLERARDEGKTLGRPSAMAYVAARDLWKINLATKDKDKKNAANAELAARLSKPENREKFEARVRELGSRTEGKIRKLLADGVGVVKIGKTVGVGTGTVQRIKAEMADGAAA